MKVAQLIIDAAGDPQLIEWNEYRAPHALRGTPKKPHFKRQRKFRLFKGHRP